MTRNEFTPSSGGSPSDFLSLSPSDLSQFAQRAGFVPDETSSERILGHIDLGPDHHTPWGIVHGGVYASAVESAASIGASLAVHERGEVAVGLTNTTQFLRSMTSGRVTVEAIAMHQGRSHQLWQVAITAEDGSLVAHGELRLQNIAVNP